MTFNSQRVVYLMHITLEVARRVEAFKIDISIYSGAPNLYRGLLLNQGIANGDLHEHIHAAVKPHPRRLYC